MTCTEQELEQEEIISDESQEEEIVQETGETKPKRKKKREKAKSRVVLDLERKIEDVTLKLMNMRLVRGSDEHIELRNMLNAYREELDELGVKRGFSMEEFTKEELREARKRGEEKKREKRERREEKHLVRKSRPREHKEE